MGRVILGCLLLLGIAAGDAAGQAVVQVGKGSYAASLPAGAGRDALAMAIRELLIINPDHKPVPTNQWWTYLIVHPFGGALWAYPFKVEPGPQGINIFYPTSWNNSGSDMQADHPLLVGGSDFTADSAKPDRWGNWTVSFRMAQGEDRSIEVTLGRGLPYAWLEYHGCEPRITAPDAECVGLDGQAAAFPVSSDALAVNLNGRWYGLFTPDGAQFTREGEQIAIHFSGDAHFLTVAALPDAKSLSAFRPYAFAVPRDSELTWDYDPAKGAVTTHWKLTTECLKGTEHRLIQGWIPHHYRGTQNDLAFDGINYATPRGTMKCALGDEFTITFPFHGFTPFLPAPQAMGLANDFDPQRMHAFIERYAAKTDYGADTYWGGKDVLLFAQYLAAALQLHDPSAGELREHLHHCLADWFTYTPGEDAHYFARYDNFKALIGFHSSYGSEGFNDNHFHYGYFTYAMALATMDDPSFGVDYGPMATLVAREYANWDRTNPDFPFLRCFDCWEGHSWAGGTSSGGGENQESSSEAMQSWGGLFLLGAALNNRDMMAAGAMGYSMESRAVMEYWFNIHGDVFPPQFKHPFTGMVWSGGMAYGTYFSGDPGWIYGIQCLPVSPILGYLAENPAFAEKEFKAMLALRLEHERANSISSMGTGLGNVILSHVAQFDPDWSAAQFDELYKANDVVAHDNGVSGMSDYIIHSLRILGDVQPDYYMTVPLSRVYHNPRTGKTWYTAYNIKAYPQLAHVYHGNEEIGTLLLPAHTMVKADALQPVVHEPGVVGSSPAANDSQVSRFTDAIDIVFSQPVKADSLGGIALSGPSAPKVTAKLLDDPTVVELKLGGLLKTSQQYQVTVPTTVAAADGRPLLPAGQTISFTVEPQPPLALTDADPADGAMKVKDDLKQITVNFNGPIDPSSLEGIRLAGPGDPAVAPELAAGSASLHLLIRSGLQSDSHYELSIPATVRGLDGQTLGKAATVGFTSAPPPCPPNIYGESFAGGAIVHDDGVVVDLQNTENPHTGKFAIKLTSPDRDGSVYFLAGTSDNGPGRAPLDLSAYDRVQFWLAGSADSVWVKIGHPVFDGAFSLNHLTDVTAEYKRYTIPLPTPKTGINTLLAISVPKGGTLYLDDVKLLKPGEP